MSTSVTNEQSFEWQIEKALVGSTREERGAVLRLRLEGVRLVVGLGPVAGVEREDFGQHEIPARLEPDARAVGRVGVLGAVHEGRVPQDHD